MYSTIIGFLAIGQTIGCQTAVYRVGWQYHKVTSRKNWESLVNKWSLRKLISGQISELHLLMTIAYDLRSKLKKGLL